MSDVMIDNDRNEIAGGRGLYEPNTVNIPGVVKFFVGLFLAVALAALLMWGLFRYFDWRRVEETPPISPLATGIRFPPEPRLQGAPGHAESPTQDIRQFREKENQMLDSYGWIDKQNGILHIPIDQAKALILRRGLPATPSGARQSGAKQGMRTNQ